MRVAVLGAGNGGVASAFDFAQHGHEVSLYGAPEFAVNTVAVHQAGGITASGDLEGFAEIRYAGHDVAEAVAGAELVVVVGPAYSTEPLAVAVAPHLGDGMAVLVCPGSCAGAIAFKPTIDAIITIASVVLARDFRGEGIRTLTTLGLDAMSPEELAAL